MQLDRFGRPVNWNPTDIIQQEWGSLRVFIGYGIGDHLDLTYFRGIPTEIVSFGYVEPFGYGPAVISFPQISPFDRIGFGDLDWMKHGANVTIYRLHPDGLSYTPMWEGFTASWEPEQSDDGYKFTMHLTGALHQASLEPHPPPWFSAPVDMGVAISQALDNVPGRRYATTPVVQTGIMTRNRGSWTTVLDYVQEMLSTAYTVSGEGFKQWTMTCLPGRLPRLVLKDTTTQHWTVSMGAPGVNLRETSDIVASVNVIYGEGVDERDGCRWRNSRYPASYDKPVFVPLAGLPQNMPYLYDDEAKSDGDGVGWDVNPAYDTSLLRVARYENYGTGITLEEGKRSARAELSRDSDPGWSGTLELTSDPEEGCKLDIRAGQNIGVRNHHGAAVRLFHIAQVEMSPDGPGYKVSLTVDTNNRDAITIAGIRARDKEAATDPARRLNPPRRRSRGTMDEHPVFDCESGAGVFPAWSVPGGQWSVRRVPFAAWGSIVRTYFATSPATRYAAGVWGKEISASVPATLVGNPLGSEDPWDPQADALSDSGLQVAWGSSVQAGGYYPGQQDKGSPVTGRMLDDAQWDYLSATPPWVWLAVYPESSTTLTGKFDAAPDA